jgi:predicted MFS family arabinose efflux permease
MFAPYLDVLRRPGAFAMSGASFVARLPISMIGLGIVLLVSLQTGSYALAGALSAANAIANAAIAPGMARLVDRYGQHLVLPWLTGIHVLSLVVFMVLVMDGAPTVSLFAAVIIEGATMPSIGAMVRARWAVLLAGDPPRLRTAFAYESVVDEMIFVAGPPVATVIAVSLVHWGALALCAVLVTVGTALLVPQRRTEPPPASAELRGGPSALRYPGVVALTLVCVLLGGLFGAFEVVTVAFAAENGVPGAAGILLGLYSLGSGIAGLTLGALHLTIGLHRQLLVAAALLALVTLPFPFISSIWVMGVVALLAGVAVSPVLISAFALVERLVPNARLTEGLVWVNTGMMLGIACTAALAGAVIDAHGASTAYFICSGAALATFGAVAVAWPNLDRAWVAAHA